MACPQFTETQYTIEITAPALIRLEGDVTISQAIVEYLNSQGVWELVTILTASNIEVEVNKNGTYRITKKVVECDDPVEVVVIPMTEYKGITATLMYDVLPEPICHETNYTELFSGETIYENLEITSITKVADDGNGITTIEYRCVDLLTADRLYAILQRASTTRFTSAGGQDYWNWGGMGDPMYQHQNQVQSVSILGNIVTVTWDHTTASDTPPALPTPCTGSSIDYAGFNAAFRNAYQNFLALNEPYIPIDYFRWTVTIYEVTDCIPIKQIEAVLPNGTIETSWIDIAGNPYFLQGTPMENCPNSPRGISITPVYDVYPGKGADCETSQLIETFTPAQLISYTKIVDSGNGDFTVVYELSDQADSDRFFATMAAIAGPQNRTTFDVAGPWMHPRQIDSYTQDELFVTVKWDHTDIEEDLPDPLILPCVDSVAPQNYDTANDALRAFYEAVPLGVPQIPTENFTYIVTQYVATGLECKAIKQVETVLSDGTVETTYIDENGAPYIIQGNISINGCECCDGVEPIEIPDGFILPPDGQQSLAALTGSIRSFAVKALAGGTYDISFDNGATWLVGIDGADEYGQGNVLELDVSNTIIRAPSENNVYVHWEYVI